MHSFRIGSLEKGFFGYRDSVGVEPERYISMSESKGRRRERRNILCTTVCLEI